MRKVIFQRGQALLTRYQSGQALLIVLLSMAVILTVVLSTVSRSVTDIKVSNIEEDALRAFSAAEAGVEESLFTGSGASGDLGSGGTVSYDATVGTPITGSYYNFPEPIASGDSATFWFISHDADNNLVCGVGNPCLTTNLIEKLCWGTGTFADPAKIPAVELTIYYDADQGGITSGNFDSVTTVRAAYDPNSGRRTTNKFSETTAGSCVIGSKTYPFQAKSLAGNTIHLNNGNPFSLDVTNCTTKEGCLLMAKVRLLYNNVPQPLGILVPAPKQLPAQGTLTESTGTAGESTRRVNVFQGFPDIPSAFDSAVFSGSDLTK